MTGLDVSGSVLCQAAETPRLNSLLLWPVMPGRSASVRCVLKVRTRRHWHHGERRAQPHAG